MPVDAPLLDTPRGDAPGEGAIDAPVPAIATAQVAASSSITAANAVAFPDPVQDHDAIIVCFTFPSGSATLQAITDSLDNTYSVVVGPVVTNGLVHYIALASNSAAGSDTVTVTLSAAESNNNSSEALALEYTGLALTDPFDAADYDSAGSGTVMSSGSVTTSVAHELLLAYGHSSDPMAGPGYTARDSGGGNSLVEDRIVFATGNYTATATTDAGIWTLILATFAGR
jgi:hypothetical protein